MGRREGPRPAGLRGVEGATAGSCGRVSISAVLQAAIHGSVPPMFPTNVSCSALAPVPRRRRAHAALASPRPSVAPTSRAGSEPAASPALRRRAGAASMPPERRVGGAWTARQRRVPVARARSRLSDARRSVVHAYTFLNFLGFTGDPFRARAVVDRIRADVVGLARLAPQGPLRYGAPVRRAGARGGWRWGQVPLRLFAFDAGSLQPAPARTGRRVGMGSSRRVFGQDHRTQPVGRK